MMAYLAIANDDESQMLDLMAGRYDGAAVGLRVLWEGRTTTRNQRGRHEERIPLVHAYLSSKKAPAVDLETVVDLMAERAEAYIEDDFETMAFWLYEQANEECAPRRGLVYSMRLEKDVNRLLRGGGSFPELVVERGPWESPEVRVVTADDLSVRGGTLAIPGNGTLPGRVAKLTIGPTADASGVDTLVNFLVGMRPLYRGVDNFDAEIDPSIMLLATDTSLVSGRARTTFATNQGLTARATFFVSDMAGANTQDYFGEYLVLAQIRTFGGSGVQWGVQLQGEGVVSEQIYVNDSSATVSDQIVELGALLLPSLPMRGQELDLDNTLIYIRISLESGTPTTNYFEVERLFLMPARHHLRLEGASVSSSDADSRAEFFMHPEESELGLSYTTDADVYRVILYPESVNFFVPPEGGVLVLVSDLPSPADVTADVRLEIADRWRGYRND